MALTQPRRFWARWRVRAGYPVAVVYWVLAAPTERSILMGGIVAAFGLLIRGVSAGYLRKDEELAKAGPYACTRNPLYLGSAFLAAGFIVAGFSWEAGAVVAAYFGVFYYAVMRSEERDLRERFGAAFDEYAARVPLFFPTASRTSAEARPGPAFSLTRYIGNREYQALVGTIAGLGVLWLRMWLRTRFGH